MSDVVKERFAAIAAKYDGLGAIDLGRAMVESRKRLDEVSAEKAIAEADYEFLRSRLPAVMEAEGISKFSVVGPDGEEKRIRYQEEVSVSATQESGAAGRVIDILKDSGNGGLVKETVAPATLKKFICDLRKQSDGMPDPLLMELTDAGVVIKAFDQARFY